MLRITASSSATGAKKYFGDGLARPDYYLDGQEIAGRWGGKAAERLGLSGDVDQERYFALCDNRDPSTGTRLTPRDRDDRRVGYDFTFSAPKSVSVLYELSGDERILDAFRDSVRETMTEIESEMKTRVRRNGANEDRVTGNLAYAEFIHLTSRPVDGVPDPHLHAHCYVHNLTWVESEQRFQAAQVGGIKRDGPYWEAAFDARLASRLNALGYATEKNPRYSFELAGVPRSVIDTFSSRRNAIEQAAAQRGITDPIAKHEITRRTRERKADAQSREELRRDWDRRLSPDERAALVDVLDGRQTTAPQVTPEQAMQFAVDHSFERHSTVSQKRLSAEALRYGVGSVLPEDIARLATRDDIIRVEKDGQSMVTTRRVLAGEIAMLAFAREGRGSFAPLGDPSGLASDLTAEQGAAAIHVLQSRDRVVAVRGAAGTGKTHMMKATIGAIEGTERTSGCPDSRVFVFAPSAQASRGVLRGEGFKDAQTLELLLMSDKLQEETRNHVLWVDEAGLISSKDMGRLFQVARRNNNRIVLSGDYRQHAAVHAGDAFRLLESEAGVRFAELRKVRRQRPADYRKAIETISDGTRDGACTGYELLNAMGAIVEASGDRRHQLLVRDYLQAKDEGRSALIVAPTHAEADHLTHTLRAALRSRGDLGQKEQALIVRKAAGWTDAQKRDARNYREAGLMVEFHQNVAGERDQGRVGRGFKRGERAAVLGEDGGRVRVAREDGSQAVLPDQPTRFEVYRTHELQVARGDRLRVTKNLYLTDAKGQQKRLNNGDIVDVEGFTRQGDLRLTNGVTLPRTVGHLASGYVQTSHASQGRTVDAVFIAAGDGSLPAVNAQTFYVAASRGRDSVRLYVDSKEEMREAIGRSGSRLAAVELVRPPSERPSRRLREILERNRVLRYLRTRADGLARSWRQRDDRGLTHGSPRHA